jgi:type IV secretion system protein TrbL
MAAMAGATAAAVHTYAALRGDGAVHQSDHIRSDLGGTNVSRPSSMSPAMGAFAGGSSGATTAAGGSGGAGAAAAGPAAAVVMGAQAAASTAKRAAQEAGDAMSDEHHPGRGGTT